MKTKQPLLNILPRPVDEPGIYPGVDPIDSIAPCREAGHFLTYENSEWDKFPGSGDPNTLPFDYFQAKEKVKSCSSYYYKYFPNNVFSFNCI